MRASPNIQRPDPAEYAAFFGTYVAEVGPGDILHILERQKEHTSNLLRGVSEALSRYRYAPNKWSIREIVGHLADGERVFAYRAMRIARGDQTPLPGFDENLFVSASHFDEIPLAELIADLRIVRDASLSLFRLMNDDELNRKGIASDHHVSVRAFPYIIAGHESHHLRIIEERYLVRDARAH